MWGAVLLGTAPVPAGAQISVDARVEGATDERRRGISWSDGDAIVAASATASIPAGFDLGVRAVTLRGSAGHGGADAVFDVTGGYAIRSGGWRFDAFARGHLFSGGRGRLDYVEGGVQASYLIGPADVGVQFLYAPSQAAIGGDNLHLGATARIGVSTTPYSVIGGIGRSSGRVGDPVRAARLRPGGGYTDWSLGVERSSGPLTLGLVYSGTDIRDGVAGRDGRAGHVGDRLTARIAMDF